MKKLLLTTSALVAFAGYAAAEVSFGGEVTVGYNSEINGGDGGIYLEGSLDLTGTAEFDSGVSVEVTYGYDLYTGDFDDFPTITVTTQWATLTVGSVEFAGTDMFSAVDGMETNWDWREEDGEVVARVDATFGAFTVGASLDTGLGNNPVWGPNYLSIGAMGEFGAFSFTMGYDQANEMLGISVGTSFGGFDVDVAYQSDGDGENSIGLGVATTFGAIGVSAYYAMNSWVFAPDAYGVAVDYTAGPLSVGAYWDGEAAYFMLPATSNFGVDIGYAVNDDISVAAGWDEGDGVYIYGLMAVGAATVGAGWSEYGDAGDEEIREGITVWMTLPF